MKKGTKEGLSQCQGYCKEFEPKGFTKRTLLDTVFQKYKVEFTFTVRWKKGPVGKKACETLIFPKVKVRMKLIQSNPAFHKIGTAGLNSEAFDLEAWLLLDR